MPFQVRQEDWSPLLGSRFPHDLAPFQRLTLAGRDAGRAIRHQLLGGEQPWVRDMRIQGQEQRWSVLNDTNSRVAVTVDPTLVALGQAKPPLQVEIVSDRFPLGPADEQPGQEADHDLGHVPADGVFGLLEAIDQRLERLLPRRAVVPSGFESRGYLLEVLDVVSDRLLLGSDMVQSPVDAAGQSSQLGGGASPFFASKLRWIESRTSVKASAIRRPGG